MKFLANAQSYALNRGDDDWFCEVYTNYRTMMDVCDSTWMTLMYLYDADTANYIKDQSV